MSKNYYSVLSLEPDATQQQIRERFLELARERHPDLFAGQDKSRAEEEFQSITEAFNVLSNPARRRQHDLEVRRPDVQQSTQDPRQVARTFLQMGARSYREGAYGEAATQFERATQMDPQNAQAWYNLALAAHREPAMRSKALSAATKACELDKMNGNYYKVAGRIFAQASMPRRAERYYRQALKWLGEDPEIENAIDALRRSK